MDWLKSVLDNGGERFECYPYWGFDDLFHKAGTKLRNCFFVCAETKIVDGAEFFLFNEILMLKTFSLEKFVYAIESGNVYIDFDARTGHNVIVHPPFPNSPVSEGSYQSIRIEQGGGERLRHNHGTKFRIVSKKIIDLYAESIYI